MMKFLLIILAACIVAIVAIAFFIWHRFKVRKVYNRKEDQD